MFDTNLRRNKLGNQPMWSKEELLAGLQYFYELYGRFPTAHDIDAFDYLPSSRSIQRTYGGLVKLRSELLPTEVANYTQGKYRSAKAKETYANGRDLEKAFYEYLVTIFQEIAIHEHKLIRPGNVSSDFYIYLTPHTGVIIDVFYAESMINLINVVNIKLKRYVLVEQETYLVIVGNDAIDNEDLVTKMQNKRLPLPSHVHVVTEAHFKEVISLELLESSRYGL